MVFRHATRRTGGFLVVVAAAASFNAQALTLADLGFSADAANSLEGQLYTPGVSPAIAFGSPIGFGTGYTEFFGGVGGQTMPDTAPDPVDGSMSVGVGIGDPVKWIALEASTTIISLDNAYGEDGNLNLKLHHVFPYQIGVSVGVENTGRWGAAAETNAATYAAVTKPISLGLTSILTLNAGIGNGRFAEPQDNTVGGFGSVALSFARRFSVIADWTGRDLNAGLSLVPLSNVPLVVTLGAINLQERYGTEIQFAGGIGYTFRLK